MRSKSWAIGFIVAPTLFGTLGDRVLAGNIAGSMFRAEAWLSIVCALVLLALLQWSPGALEPKRRRLLGALVLSMLVCALLSHFGITPLMAELKAQAPSGIMDDAMRHADGNQGCHRAQIQSVQDQAGVTLIQVKAPALELLFGFCGQQRDH